ncbi:antirepressor [Gordonia phage Malisha]|nr:antirepressor [Gordonia phage Malisha]
MDHTTDLIPNTAPIVSVDADGEGFTTSLVVAEGTGNEHASVIKLIRNNLADFDEFGRVGFEIRPFATAGGTQQREVAILNEPQATLLITYLRNNEVVRAFKKRLVAAFYALRNQTIETLTPLEYARKLVNAEERAEAEHAAREKAEKRLAVEQKHRAAIEGGDGIHLTDFGKKYFSEVPARKFDEHLYAKGWLINQRNTRVRADGSIRDGYDHRKPTAKGRRFIYDHDQGNHGGKRRFQPRVRPQMEIALRDALAAEGLPVNTHSTGLVLITNEEMKELGA